MIISYHFEQALRLVLNLDESAVLENFKNKVAGVDYDYIFLQVNGDAVYQVGFDHSYFAINRVTEDGKNIDEVYDGSYEEFEAKYGFNPQKTPMKNLNQELCC